MKLGLISDVHGNHLALKVTLSRLYKRVDQILFAGDLVGYYPFVNECVELWNADKIIGICGNHDRILLNWVDNDKKPASNYFEKYGSALKRTKKNLTKNGLLLLRSWPREKVLNYNNTSILLVHGSPWDPLNGRIYPDFTDWDKFNKLPYDIIVLGHTHYQLLKHWKGKLIVNPGSVGQPRDKGFSASFTQVDLKSGEVKHFRLKYDFKIIASDAILYNPDNPYLAEVLKR